MEEIIYPKDNDVVCLQGSGIMPNPTAEIHELRRKITGLFLKEKAASPYNWLSDGLGCRLLQAEGGGWREGRIRLRLEFVPNDPTPPKQPQTAKAPLDDLRQQVDQLNPPNSD